MAKYVQKPMVIEAEKVVAGSPLPYEKEGAVYTGDVAYANAKLLYGDIELSVADGDYIVKRDDGEFYPITKEEFEAYYEPEG